MACGSCGRAKARRKATLEKRRAAERQRQAERQAKALAAQPKLQFQQEPIVQPSAE